MNKYLSLIIGLLMAVSVFAQTDTTAVKKNAFNMSANCWSRGEIRSGALPDKNVKEDAIFLMNKAELDLEYRRKGLQVHFSPKFCGVWGSSGSGNLVIDEAWFGLEHKGWFMRLGRQALAYDDQRIIGDDDWVMAAGRHDLLKTGYEGGKHKVHVLLAFNQNDENIQGGTFYKNGGQPYKAMETLWYHFDPIPQLGFSLLFMNMGVQDTIRAAENYTAQQQLFGGYVDWHPRNFRLQASYYRQTGMNEHRLPIHAWMTAVEADWDINSHWHLNSGYFFLSGDPYFFVPPEGDIGMARKTEVRGFNLMFGSHHAFYGAMDFFYLKTYYGGNTPGLQDFHIGGRFQSDIGLTFTAAYHYLGTGVKIQDLSRTLGHELELSGSWKITKDIVLSAGYSYMHGTETMIRLKRTSDKNRLSWGWLMLTVTPKIFDIKW
jgi:hypothetical protein